MAIGYGASYPAVAQAIEKYEVVTITGVGKQGTQAWLSMDAKAGDTNIKVSSVENISVGDKIRLDIDSEGHGIETVTVTGVGTQSVRSTFNGPLKDTEDPGTGLDLAEPLKFNHASNMPFSARGTGISFEPATSFVHSSNEPVLALRYGITLDQPLANDHDIDDVVRDEKVTIAGYQGTKEPDQWFGGPALSASAGNMVLSDADGNVVDGLNYGGLVDPWAAEGYQAASGAGESGCSVSSPGMSRGFRMGPSAPTSQPDRSAGRYPDGADSDFNCRDFLLQNTITVLAPATAGSNNIKVASVADLSVGHKIIIGKGTNTETAIISAVGTPGGTTVGTSTSAGKKVILVANVEGFNPGQTVTIGSGKNLETVIIAVVAPGRRRFGGAPGSMPADTIKVTVPLKYGHAAGTQVSGSGITFADPLSMAHENGTLIASSLPTPGEPNQYIKKTIVGERGEQKRWPWWRLIMTGLSILALVLATVMSWHYLTGGSMAGCGGGSPCEQVLNSRWSTIAGILPVSGLAAGVYLAMLVASLFIGPSSETPIRNLAWSVMLILAGSIAGSAIWFTILQKWVIGDFCPYCMTTHFIGLLLAILVIWQAIKYFPGQNIRPMPAIGRFLIGLVLAGLLVISQVSFTSDTVFSDGESEENITVIDYHNVPVVGSPDAPYIVTLLFDYQCSHCQQIHFMLEEAIRRYAGKLAFALCPAPLNTQCNPYIPRDVDEFKNSCDLAKIGLAVWVAKREVFSDFENWMFTFESGDSWHPRSPETARAKAVDLVGQDKFDTAMTDPWIGRYLQATTRIYGQTLQNGMGGIPKLIFGSRWVIPQPDSSDDLVTILQNSLAVPRP